MRRADRLFRIVDELRRRRRAMTAAQLAENLEVSHRTIYRDIADLKGSGVPIDGEAGVGYVLRPGYHLPPLMFDVEELEALVLGARIVESWSDESMAAAAARAVSRIEAAVPDGLRRRIDHLPLLAPRSQRARTRGPESLPLYRAAIDARTRLRITYADEDGRRTRRTVWPLGLMFYGPVWLLAAWCELRQDFRSFRLDRVAEVEPETTPFEPVPGRQLQDFLRRTAE